MCIDPLLKDRKVNAHAENASRIRDRDVHPEEQDYATTHLRPYLSADLADKRPKPHITTLKCKAVSIYAIACPSSRPACARMQAQPPYAVVSQFS